jgi:hypothetical protein
MLNINIDFEHFKFEHLKLFRILQRRTGFEPVLTALARQY